MRKPGTLEVRGWSQQLRFRAILEMLRKLLEQIRRRTTQSLDMFERVSAGARASDLLLAGRHLRDGTRQLAPCAPEVNLECECVDTKLAVDDPLQRRVRNESAIPIVFAFNLHGAPLASETRSSGSATAAPHPHPLQETSLSTRSSPRPALLRLPRTFGGYRHVPRSSAPGARTKGTTPKMKARDVIRIGRGRRRGLDRRSPAVAPPVLKLFREQVAITLFT
jgi:hypothetical protein